MKSALLLFAGLCVVWSSSHAQSSYPNRPIRLLVGFTPGGATDLVGRIVAEKLSERLGQQVVVDNRPGASGIIAARLVGTSQPDGYTLLVSGSSISIVGSLYASANFDVQRDLEPLALLATTPYVMVTHPSTGVKSVAELITYAKAKANKISYGAAAAGAVQHLSGEMFKRLVGIDMLFVHYKGASAMTPDLLSGRLQVAVDNILVLATHIGNGTLNALAVTTAKRSPLLPNVPTLAESGIASLSTFDTGGWFSMYVAHKTPQAVIKRLSAEILAFLDAPDVKSRLLKLGATPLPGTPDQLRRQLTAEVPRWRKVIQDAGLKIE